MGGPVDLGRLDAEVERALALFRAGRPAASLRVLRRVRRRLLALSGAPAVDQGQEIARLLATTLMREAGPLFDVSGDLPAALQLIDEAREAALAAASVPLDAKIRGQRALLILRSGDTRGALRAFDEAAELVDQADLFDRAIILLNRGVVHLEHLDLVAARADFTASLRWAELAEDHAGLSMVAMARHNLAYVDFLAGRIPTALAGLQVAEAEYGADPHPTALLDRARVLREAGLFEEAATILEQVSGRMAAERLYQDLGETELVRAECALVEGNLKQARALALSSQRRFARRGNVRWQRKAELLLLRCDDALAESKVGRVRERALSSLAARSSSYAETCRVEGRRDLARMASLLATEARLRLGEDLDEPVPRQRETDPLQVRLQTREVRALAALNAGRPARAAAEVRAGLTELGSYQQSLGSLDLRTASAVHGSSLARLGLDIVWRTGSPASVLGHVEQSRAISTRLPSISPPTDEVTAGLLSELRRVEEEARGLEGDPSADAALLDLREDAVALQRRIRARAWEIEGAAGAVTAAPKLADVRRAAEESGSAFASFARHRGRWVAVAVRGGRASLHDLASISEITALVQRVRADLDALAMPMLPPPLRASILRSLQAGLAGLDATLLDPLACKGIPLVLSVSGDLVLLPWGLLPSRVGWSTVVTPSAASWLRGQGERRPSAPRVIAVGGPDLRRSVDEADRVAKLWPGAASLVGDAATTAATQDALHGADLLHVAAHGTHRQDNPLFSSVRLADGHLYAYEVEASVGIAACVVLSACEAGLATLRPGDESLGLTHVLLQLGSRSVLAGVAKVGDEVAADLMEGVHRAMASGADSASALAEAQATSLYGGSPVAFVAFGAPW